MPPLAAGHGSPQAARHHAPLLAAVRCLPPLLQPPRHSPWQYTGTYWCFVQTLLVMHATRQVPTGGHSSLPTCSQARCCHHCSLRVSIQTTVSSIRLVNHLQYTANPHSSSHSPSLSRPLTSQPPSPACSLYVVLLAVVESCLVHILTVPLVVVVVLPRQHASAHSPAYTTPSSVACSPIYPGL